MIAIRALVFALAAFAAGIAAQAAHGVHGHLRHITHHAEGAAVSPRADICAQPPTLCTGEVVMYGYATTLTYLCSHVAAPTAIHVTVTKATTITPTVTPTATKADPTVESPAMSSAEPTTTVHATSTSTVTRTITLVSNTKSNADVTAIPITDKFSVTIPTELLTQSTAYTGPASVAQQSRFTVQTTTPLVSESRFTVQTSTPVPTTAFPSLTLSASNGTTSGVFYTHSMANSSVAMLNSSMMITGSSVSLPIPLFLNTTSHKHYATPTLKMAQAAETSAKANSAFGAMEDINALLAGLLGSLAMVALMV